MSTEIKLKTPELETIVVDDGVEEVHKENLLMGESQINEHENIIDELTSIERDLAIMHDIEEDEAPNVLQSGIVEEALAMGIASSTNDTPGEKQDILPSKADGKQDNAGDKVIAESRNGPSNNSETTNDAPDSTTGSATAVVSKSEEAPLMHDDLLAVLKGTDTEDSREGVTIEGEGEFQIVDIIDSEVESTETDPLSAGSKEVQKPLTKEQVRKVALEQIQALARPAREPKSRRKQDIKPITQPADLLNSLVSDWSDGDEANAEDSEGSAPPAKKKAVVQLSQVKAIPSKSAAPQTTKAVSSAKPTQTGKPAAVPATKVTISKAPQKLSVQKPDPSASAATDKGKDQSAGATAAAAASKKTITTAQPKKLNNAEKKQPDPPPQPTFKRTRIIKRKIIWDPDAPETQFSYAKLVKPSVPTPAKKEKTAIPKLKDNDERATRSRTPPVKRPPSTTPSVNGGNRKKNTREIDRLLGDEGAVNMLNSLESERSKRTPDSDTISPRAAAARKSTAITSAATTAASTVEKPQATAAAKRESLLAKNRKTKPKASSTWDYVYKQKKQQDDDAMIIRRRSNSSYSSSASINRLSVDAPGSSNRALKTTKTSIGSAAGAGADATTPTDNQFEFAKPETKAKAKRTTKSPIILVNALSVDMKRATAKRQIKTTKDSDDEDEDYDDEGDIEEISLEPKQAKGDVKVLSIGNVKQVIFNTHRSKLANTFTVQLLNELSRVLEVLARDTDCNAVLMLSEGAHFCQGIDFTDLTIGTAEKRKTAAIQMAKAVKNFLMMLAQFNKPLIAGVNGSNSGLGVTMLPLFDVVIGSDKGTYETPYAKIGQIPEGYYIFSETTKIRSTFKTKLLWLAEKLHSTESALSGLINKLTSIGKVNEEALSAAKRIASLAPETYSVMKKRSIESALPLIIEALEEEEEILVRQWCSAPCLDKFKHFIQKGQW